MRRRLLRIPGPIAADGQRELEVQVFRRARLQRPRPVTVPRPLAQAVAGVFGGEARAVLSPFRDNLLRVERQTLRWMEPVRDADGRIVRGADGKPLKRERATAEFPPKIKMGGSHEPG